MEKTIYQFECRHCGNEVKTSYPESRQIILYCHNRKMDLVTYEIVELQNTQLWKPKGDSWAKEKKGE